LFFKDYQFHHADLEPTNATKHQLTDFRDVVIGTHVVIPFFSKNPITKDSIMYHHGIYIGNKMVIDNNDREPSLAEISEVDFFKINNVDPQVFYTVDYENYNEYERNNVIERAKDFVQHQDNLSNKLYDEMTFNCEGFATYCITGINRSVKHLINKVFEIKLQTYFQNIGRSNFEKSLKL
jgi:hypothetical protein